MPTAVVTVSDTRTLEDDTGGDRVLALLEAAGHGVVERRIVPDEPGAIAAAVRELTGRADVSALVLTGGTGVALERARLVTLLCRALLGAC